MLQIMTSVLKIKIKINQNNSINVIFIRDNRVDDELFQISFSYLYLQNASQYGLILHIFISNAENCLLITLKTAVT